MTPAPRPLPRRVRIALALQGERWVRREMRLFGAEGALDRAFRRVYTPMIGGPLRLFDDLAALFARPDDVEQPAGEGRYIEVRFDHYSSLRHPR